VRLVVVKDADVELFEGDVASKLDCGVVVVSVVGSVVVVVVFVSALIKAKLMTMTKRAFCKTCKDKVML
jgi:hypothetical protein